jgi:hypothetical protein
MFSFAAPGRSRAPTSERNLLAVGAITAQAAPAAQFHSEVEPTALKLSSTSVHAIKTTAFEFKCESTSFEGSQATKTAASITVTSFYSQCAAFSQFGKSQVTISFNGCDHRLFANGEYQIECPAGKSIELAMPGCVLKIPAQTLAGLGYANNGKHIDVTWNVSGLSYSHSGFLCGTGSGTDGTYSGTATAVGKNSKGEVVKYWWE